MCMIYDRKKLQWKKVLFISYQSGINFSKQSRYAERLSPIPAFLWCVAKLFCFSIFMEWVSSFLGSWEMNRSAEQTNRVNREADFVRFVCSALRFISHEPRKKDTHSLYLQCLQRNSLLKFSEQSKKFKFPSEIGNMTLFSDKTIFTLVTPRVYRVPGRRVSRFNQSEYWSEDANYKNRTLTLTLFRNWVSSASF